MLQKPDRLRQQLLVDELKELCTADRERIYQRHRFGIGGREICEEYTRLADRIIRLIYQSGTEEGNGRPILSKKSPVAILALGGYGRRELNPYSDIDIMVIYDDASISPKELEPFASMLITTLWDISFEVGHSCRSLKECIQATYENVFSKTSIIETRLITGKKSVYQEFLRLSKKHIYKRQVERFIRLKIQEWSERHESYGSTIYLQEPDVKESVGGLRDFHTGMWVASIRYGTDNLEALYSQGIIPRPMLNACVRSLDFMLRLRNELHYINRRRDDRLSFEIQETLAKNLGYKDDHHHLAEEFLMRDYYLNAEHLFEFAKMIIARVKYRESLLRRLIDRWRTKRLPDGFAIIRKEIRFQDGESDFGRDIRRIMKVFQHRQRLGNRVSADVRHQITLNLRRIDDEFRYSPEIAKIFLDILRHPRAVAETLRLMHRWKVLDLYIPEFGRVRSLVKFDRYHQYTVDEHTLYAIENLEKERLGELREGRIFINIMQEIKKPELLRLAILLHDIGKGAEGAGSHDRLGVEMAAGVLDRLGLEPADREIVLFLISRHLDMAYTAQQRDIDDPKVIQRFSEMVEDEQRLKMLYLLTFADLRAVSPNVWNEWKAILLWQLYSKTLAFLQGKEGRARGEEIRARVRELIGDTIRDEAIARHFETMPEEILNAQTPELIAKEIRLVEQLDDAPLTMACFEEDRNHTQIGICTRDAHGIFRRITGVLASENINILSAVITTRNDDIVIDLLNLSDGESGKGPITERYASVKKTLNAVWDGKVDVEGLLQGNCRPDIHAHIHRRRIPPRITIDNNGSDRATIIDIHAPDRVGLLFEISNTLYELGLNISLAKITTEAAIASDSFYVTDAGSQKITSAAKLAEIEERLKRQLKITSK